MRRGTRTTDLTGRSFGRWTVVRFEGVDSARHSLWLVRCGCEKETERTLRGKTLTAAESTSCGCRRDEVAAAFHAKDLLHQRFGRWTVLERRPGRNEAVWLCVCACGESEPREVLASSLTSGTSQSCGCKSRETAIETHTTHGLSTSTEYKIWQAIRQRCENPRNGSFYRYGARGIELVERWQTFENFYADMGPRPGKEFSVERAALDGPYSPENCTWEDVKTQANNTSRNHVISYNGLDGTMAQWAELLGMSYNAFTGRILGGWTTEQAITIPRGGRRWATNRPRNAA